MAKHELSTVRAAIAAQAAEALSVSDLPNMDQQIVSKFTYSVLTATTLHDTMWPGEIQRALRSMVDLIVMADRGQFKPGPLRRMQIYRTVTDSLRDMVEAIMMIQLGEEADFGFALQRGFEDLLKEEVKKIQDQGACSCKIRFVQSKKVTQGQFPVYERITVRFDGQFEISIIDRARYGM